MPAILAAAAEGCAVAEEVVDGLLVIRTEHAGLTAACIARAAQSLMSVCHLAQLGLNGDAMSVARTIVEITIDVGYIASAPATLVPRFIGYADVRDDQLVRAIARLHSGNVDQNAMQTIRQRRNQYLAQNPDSNQNWAGESLRYRAEHVAGDADTRRHFLHTYELLYAEMCGATHSGQTTLRYTLTDDDEPAIYFGPAEPSTRPVALACTAMLLLVDTAVEIFNLPEPFHQSVRRLNAALGLAESAPAQR